jgi:hypothetical protein
MTEPITLSIQQLKDIIATQALLVSEDFDLQRFMNVAVERVLALTSASGAAIELVEHDQMVYQSASGVLPSPNENS